LRFGFRSIDEHLPGLFRERRRLLQLQQGIPRVRCAVANIHPMQRPSSKMPRLSLSSVTDIGRSTETLSSESSIAATVTSSKRAFLMPRIMPLVRPYRAKRQYLKT
jgi:hypothetical protein